MSAPSIFQVEVFCPHCREAMGIQFSEPVYAPFFTTYPRFDRTIQNVDRSRRFHGVSDTNQQQTEERKHDRT